MVSTPRMLVAEAFGTFILVFAGTGAILINAVSFGVISHVGIALTFGLVVMALIYALGDVSGCHLNPAVTLGFWAARRFSTALVPLYILSQCVGGLLASLSLWYLFPAAPTLGATIPAGPWEQSFILEFILTLFLMFVILSVATGSREKGMLAGVAIGGVIALEAMFAGPICGASMNPARSLAPALVARLLDPATAPTVVGGAFETVWIYLAAPVLGALASVLLCRCIHESNCCCSPTTQETFG